MIFCALGTVGSRKVVYRQLLSGGPVGLPEYRGEYRTTPVNPVMYIYTVSKNIPPVLWL